MKNLGKITYEVLRHNTNPEGEVTMVINCFAMVDSICGKTAFYTTRKLIKNMDDLMVEDVILIDGSRPIDGITEIRCGSCGRHIDDMNELYYLDDSLTKGEQKEIRDYVRDRLAGNEIDVNRLPQWLADLENQRRMLEMVRSRFKEAPSTNDYEWEKWRLDFVQGRLDSKK